MSAGDSEVQIVWSVGTEKANRRWQRWVLIPVLGLMGLGLAAGIATKDTDSMVFILVFSAVLIGLIFGAPLLFERARAKVEPIRMREQKQLERGGIVVPVQQVVSWDIANRSTGQAPARIFYIDAAFRMDDGSQKNFHFHHITGNDARRLQVALATTLGRPPTHGLDGTR